MRAEFDGAIGRAGSVGWADVWRGAAVLQDVFSVALRGIYDVVLPPGVETTITRALHRGECGCGSESERII